MDNLLSVIALNYNGEQFVEACLTSLAKQTVKNFEIILFDNASQDNSLAIAEKLQTDLNLNGSMKIIASATNIGFCAGNNKGASHATGKYLLFLNIDTKLDEKCLENMLRSAEENPDIAIWQSKIFNSDGSLRTDGNHTDLYLGSIGPKREQKFFASGACLLIQKEVFDRIGGFDEVIVAYNEDLDLCWRARLLGYGVGCADDAICFHYASFAWGKSLSSSKFYFQERSRLRVFLKNYSTLNVLKRLIFVVMSISIKGIYLTLLKKDFRYFSAAIRAFFWNIRKIPDTLRTRKLVQSMRKVSDKEIEKHMIPYWNEIFALKKAWLTLKGDINWA
jgi:GT2 family glycosyltransferase